MTGPSESSDGNRFIPGSPAPTRPPKNVIPRRHISHMIIRCLFKAPNLEYSGQHYTRGGLRKKKELEKKEMALFLPAHPRP